MPGHCHVGSLDRSRKRRRDNSRTGCPERRRRRSASPAETGETVAHPRPNGCPIASGVSPVPAETGASSTVAAFGRVPGCRSRVTLPGRNQGKIHSSCAQTVPGCRRCVTPPAETERGQQQLRPDGVPACRRSITRFGRNRSRVRHSCAQTIARIPKPRHPPRPKPRRDRRQQRSDGCPKVEGTPPSPAETEERAASTTLGRVPVCRRYVAPGGRNRRRRRNIRARTSARLPMSHHPLRPKPKRAPPHQRPDGCPRVDGTSPPPAETEESSEHTRSQIPVSVSRPRITPPAETEEDSATSTPGRCPFADGTSRAPAETEERSATSTPERCPFADGTSPPPAEARENSEQSASVLCSFVDETSHPSAETEERFATSTPERCPFVDETSPPAAEARGSAATSTPERCPFAAVRSATRSRSHERPHAQRLPDGCPVNVTRSTLHSRSRGAHLAPRIPDGSPAAVRSTPSGRNRRTTRAHRLSDGCPVAAIRSEPCDMKHATEHVSHLDSRTGSPVAVRSTSAGRSRKTTRAHRLLDGCPVAAIRSLRHSR